MDDQRVPGLGPAVPRLVRRADDRMVAGVAGGLADHLGVDVTAVRVTLALLSLVSGFGVLLYAALWVLVPLESAQAAPPGVAAATRAGRRGAVTAAVRRGDPGLLVALLALGAGVAWLLTGTSVGVPLTVLAPAAMVGGGLALVWSQSDASQRARARRAVGERVHGQGRAGPLVLARTAAGVLLVAGGLVAYLAGRGQLTELRSSLLAVVVVVVGILLLTVPFLWQLVGSLQAERQARLLNEHRADVAAHLHDSVLQTLALIQRQAADERAVVRLARAQERDLRTWLYGDRATEGGTLRSALTAAGVDVEEHHGVPVEVVVVGDCGLDERSTALVLAAREAMVNAARHSGADSVDVYAEVAGPEVEVFVRDRGRGFDPDDVPEDRLGLRGSVLGRVERHGGQAEVRSAPGEGTEVRLALRRATDVPPSDTSQESTR